MSECVAWSPNGDWLVHSSGSVLAIDRVDRNADTLSRVTTLPVGVEVDSLSVSRDARWLACGCRDGTVIVWAVAMDTEGDWVELTRGALPGPVDGTPTLVAFSPHDDTFAIGRGEQVLLLQVDDAALAEAQVEAQSTGQPAHEATDEMATTAASTLSIRHNGATFSFVVNTPRGQLTLRIQAPPELTPHVAMAHLGLLGQGAVDPATQRVIREQLTPLGAPRTSGSTIGSALRTLRQALIPYGLETSKAVAGDNAPLSLVLDERTAGYPWELLLGGNPPLAADRGLVRAQPATRPGRADREGVALIIAATSPAASPPANIRRTEAARALSQALSSVPGLSSSQLLDRATPEALIDALFTDELRLLFIAGPSRTIAPDGRAAFVLDESVLVSEQEIAAMKEPPEIVFFSGAFMARMAPALIAMGVRVVVASLWETADAGAQTFATAFFRALTGGATLIDATLAARRQVRAEHPASTAWAAFQVHGDPAYRFVPAVDVPVDAPNQDAASVALDLSALVAPPADGVASPDPVLHAVPGRDVVVMDLIDGPTMTLDVPTARAVVEADAALRRDGAPKASLLNRALLGAWRVITGPAANSDGALLREAARRLDGRLDVGLHRLDATSPSFRPAALKPRADGSPDSVALPIGAPHPVLVLLHGDLSDTASTFGKLWTEHPTAVQLLFEHYHGDVFAFEHATLDADPIETARDLSTRFVTGQVLHLLTHSTGGLVGEILLRTAAVHGFGAEAIPAYRQHMAARDRSALSREQDDVRRQADDDAASLRALDQLAGHSLRIERMVRIACPTRGTLLASERLDAYLSVVRWAMEIAAVPLPGDAGSLISAAALNPAAFRALRGVAAQSPDAPLLRWLHAIEAPVRSELRVIAGQLEGDTLVSWVKSLLADSFFSTGNDLVVPTRSMYGGLPRVDASFLLDTGAEASHFNYFTRPRTAQAVVDALLQAAPVGFAPIGPLSWAGRSADGTR